MERAGESGSGDGESLLVGAERAFYHILFPGREGEVVDIVAVPCLSSRADKFRVLDPVGTHGGDDNTCACQLSPEGEGVAVQKCL